MNCDHQPDIVCGHCCPCADHADALGLSPLSMTDGEWQMEQESREEPEDDWTPGQTRPCPGHKWVYTGTQYGGDDERWGGEGRVYCQHCGADGDA